MKKAFIKKILSNPAIIFLVILSIGFLLSSFRYVMWTFQIPEWDEQHYMHMAAAFYRLLQAPSWDTPYQMLTVIPIRQPGYPLAVLPFLLIFGLEKSYSWAIITNVLFHIAAVFGVFFLAKQYLSKLASFAAAVLYMFYGWNLFYVHTAYTETATAALVVWTVYFLAKSTLFQNRIYTILFGIFVGLSLLTRWISLVFFIGPVLYIVFEFFRNKIFQKKEIWINIMFGLIVCLFICIWPYVINFNSVFGIYFTNHKFGGEMWGLIPDQERDPFSLYSWTFYLKSFEQLGIYFYLLFIGGFVFLFYPKSKMKIFIFSILVPWIFFSALSILKADRFILPIYPFVAIISAYLFDKIKNKPLQFGLIGLAILLSFGTFLGSVWGRGPMKTDRASIKLSGYEIHMTSISRPPYLYKKSGSEIITAINSDAQTRGIKNPQVIALFSYQPLNEPMAAYNLYHQEKVLPITNFVGSVTTDPEPQSTFYLEKIIKSADYVLLKTGNTNDLYFPKENYGTLDVIREVFVNQPNINEFYEPIQDVWIFQDSSTVTILRKKKDISSPVLQQMKKSMIDGFKQKKLNSAM